MRTKKAQTKRLTKWLSRNTKNGTFLKTNLGKAIFYMITLKQLIRRRDNIRKEDNQKSVWR